MRLRSVYAAGLLLLLFAAGSTEAASISLRRQNGDTAFTAELGQVLDLELAIEAGAEQVTGYAIHVSLERGPFRLLPAGVGADGAMVPFSPGGFLGGIELVNRVEESEGELLLTYAEAAGGAQRQAASGAGVVARFRLEVMRRPQGSSTFLRVEERGHDRVSHYVTAASPGVEQLFARPLGAAEVRITGFRILPLPDVTVYEGESTVVFDLDAYVDSTAGEVMWTHSRHPDVPTAIDAATREVAMSPPAGRVNEEPIRVVFTAYEQREGLTASDTVRVTILSRPRITAAFPDTVYFAEDGTRSDLDLDLYVADVDDLPGELGWTTSGGQQVNASVDPNSHILVLSAAADYFGQERLRFAVTDRTGLSDTTSALIVVTPVNDPPAILRLPPVYPVQSGVPARVSLADLLTDRDDDLADLVVTAVPIAGVTVGASAGSLSVESSLAGRHLISLSVTDTSGAVAHGRLVAVVLDPGATVGPRIARLPEMRFMGGQSGSLDLRQWVTDDAPVDSLSWTAVPDTGLSADVTGGVLAVSGQPGFAGTSTVRVTATDRQQNQDSRALSVSLLRPEDGLGPRVYDPGKVGLRAEEGETPIDLDALVADPDHADAAIDWQVFPSAGLEFDEEQGVLRIQEGAEPSRPASVTLKATDPTGLSHEVTVPVLIAAPGEPPQVREFPEARLDSMASTARFDLDEYAFDDEDLEAELVWTAEAEPGVTAAIDPVNHTLTIRRAETAGPPPLVTQVVLRVTDTAGQTISRTITVGLPPLFSLLPLPTITIYADQTDSSLVLSEYVTSTQPGAPLLWSVTAGRSISVHIDSLTARVHVASQQSTYQGTETVRLTATDTTGRQLSAPLRVVVQGRGLTPQIRALPTEQIEQGQVKVSVDLDDYVVDDDPDSLLQWSVISSGALSAAVAADTHVLTLNAASAAAGPHTVQLMVRDPAGNTALGALPVVVVLGGDPPVIGSLPQVLLPAGGPERRLDLAPFITDADTPTSEIRWQVTAGAGIAARVEGSQLVISVLAGQSGSQVLSISATDPDGNVASAEMRVLIQADAVAPTLTAGVLRHPVFGELIEVHVAADEELGGVPAVTVDDSVLAVAAADDGYVASFPFPPGSVQRTAAIRVLAADRAGNPTTRELAVALRWMDQSGGGVRSPDGRLLLAVPDAASGPGAMAVVYALGEAERPADSGDGPVYSVDLLHQRELEHAVTLNLDAGQEPGDDLGILRWDQAAESWEEVPTLVDEESGWLAAPVRQLGLFRIGPVSASNRRAGEPVLQYPNPFDTRSGGETNIVYQVDEAGIARLAIYNSVGQPVRVLVQGFRDVGTWQAQWDGRNARGERLASGVYLYELILGGRRRHGSIVLVH